MSYQDNIRSNNKPKHVFNSNVKDDNQNSRSFSLNHDQNLVDHKYLMKKKIFECKNEYRTEFAPKAKLKSLQENSESEDSSSDDGFFEGNLNKLSYNSNKIQEINFCNKQVSESSDKLSILDDSSYNQDKNHENYPLNENKNKNDNFENYQKYDNHTGHQKNKFNQQNNQIYNINNKSKKDFSTFKNLKMLIFEAPRIDLPFYNHYLKSSMTELITDRDLSTCLQSKIYDTDANVFTKIYDEVSHTIY